MSTLPLNRPEDPSSHLVATESDNHYWVVGDLWATATAMALIPFELDLNDLPELTCSWLAWLHNQTHPVVQAEMPRVVAADLTYPVVLHPDGWLMDGYHRVAKKILAGERKIMAVKFSPSQLPPPRVSDQ